LINLICNGIIFTETGYVFVNISGQRKDGAANVKFEVFDTGIGIPSDKITERSRQNLARDPVFISNFHFHALTL